MTIEFYTGSGADKPLLVVSAADLHVPRVGEYLRFRDKRKQKDFKVQTIEWNYKDGFFEKVRVFFYPT